VGGTLFLVLVGFYYFLYSQQQPVDEVLLNLFNESTKRTATEYGIGKTILHFFTFPFEMVYHFLPWSLLSILFISPTVRRKLRENEFIQFLLILFFANIIPYWLSVEVYPRYILMLTPLFFGALAWLVDQHLPEDGPHKKILEWLFKILMIFVIALASIPLWWDQTPNVPFRFYKAVFLLASLLVLGIFYWKEKQLRVPIMVLVLLVGRLGFDWFILPDRLSKDWGQVCKLSTIEAVSKADTVPTIYENTGFQPTNSFYSSVTAGAIIYRKMESPEVGDLIIFDPQVYIDFDYEEIDHIFLRFKKREQLLARFLGYNELRED
jgi:4-amino-4-deoxy-L-arabinose transferase-like glycosyltransferase